MNIKLQSNMSVNASSSISPREKIELFQHAKCFWGRPVESGTPLRQWGNLLVHHLQKVLDKLDRDEDIKIFPLLKISLKKNVFSLYQAYRQLLLWKMTYDPNNAIDFLKRGELYAPNYITADGEFNDLDWTKRFVLDPDNGIHDRFNLACLYWFEKESAEIWAQLKSSGSAYFGGNLDSIKKKMDPLITLRVFQLEDRLHSLLQDPKYEGNFWYVGLKKSAEIGYEYAVYYFWGKLPECEKERIINNDGFFDLISDAIDYPDDKVTYFLFSQLPNIRKENFFIWTAANKEIFKWLTLLLSPYSQSIRCEILQFVYRLPKDLYYLLLALLTDRMDELKLPSDIEIFQILWRDMTQEDKNDALEKRQAIIKNLVNAKAFNILSSIIDGLSIQQKEKFLLNDEYGIDILKSFCEKGEFDLLQKYLCLFLTTIDPVTQNETLIKDAGVFLQKFIESPNYRTWSKEVAVSQRIEALQTCSTLLDELCEKVRKELSISQSPTRASFVKMSPQASKGIALIF